MEVRALCSHQVGQDAQDSDDGVGLRNHEIKTLYKHDWRTYENTVRTREECDCACDGANGLLKKGPLDSFQLGPLTSKESCHFGRFVPNMEVMRPAIPT